MAKQKNQKENVFSTKMFLISKQVFQAFRLLKNTKETSDDTKKT